MMDFGWPEMFFIMVVIVIAVGPDEIPKVMVALGRVFRRVHYIKFAISQQFDEMMRDADMDDIRKSVNFEARDTVDEAAADEDYIRELEAEIALGKVEGGDKPTPPSHEGENINDTDKNDV